MSENSVSKNISRRDFLKYLAGLFAFLSLGGLSAFFTKKEDKSNKNSGGYGSSAYGGA